MTFELSTDPVSGLGESVSSVRMSSGNYGLLIGAPFATDNNGANTGTGQAFLISGSLLNHQGGTVNLSNPGNYSDLSIVTFTSSAVGGQLGFSVAGGFNIFGDTLGDVLLGRRMRP